VDRKKVQRKRAEWGLSHEDAVRAVVEQVEVTEGHPAYDSLDCGMLAVVDGIMYGLSLQHLLED
jgi:hypothetical protein